MCSSWKLFYSTSLDEIGDFGETKTSIPITCDSTSAINLTKNLIMNSRAKYTEIRHHFIRDLLNNGDVSIYFVHSEHHLGDIFTKPLDKNRTSEVY